MKKYPIVFDRDSRMIGFYKETGDYVEDNIELLFEKNNENFDELLDQKARADIDEIRAKTEAEIAQAAKTKKETKLMKSESVDEADKSQQTKKQK